MSQWQDVVDAAPELAERVRALFDARKHKTLATLRRDGSPRISGIECQFADGVLRLGMMSDSLKAQDLGRDARLALHSPTVDPPEGNDAAWPGEAKISGRAIEITSGDAEDKARHFRIDIDEVVLTTIDPALTHLVIESWHPDRGLQVRHRA